MKTTRTANDRTPESRASVLAEAGEDFYLAFAATPATSPGEPETTVVEAVGAYYKELGLPLDAPVDLTALLAA